MRTVADTLTTWQADNGVPAQSNTDRWLWLRLGPIWLPLPNPQRLDRHDLHHALCGYRNDLWGEIEVSAFELRTGPPDLLIGALCVAAVALGLLLGPRRLVAAWRRARGGRNLYRDPRRTEELLALPVGVLRAELGRGFTTPG